MKFTKKPVTIEAMQFDGSVESADAIELWSTGRTITMLDASNLNEFYLEVLTLEGRMRASKGDWIIRGVKGEYYPCKPDIFAATYEEAAEHVPVPPEESAAIDEAAGLVMISLRVSKELHARLVDGAASAGVVFPAYVRSLLDDREVAIAQAVEFAEYVEQHAKGKMEEAAKLFLSQSFAQEMRERLAARDFHSKFYTMRHMLHLNPGNAETLTVELQVGMTAGSGDDEVAYYHPKDSLMVPLRSPAEVAELVLAVQRQDKP